MSSAVFDRIAIGTANWGPTPYGHRGVTCPRAEQEDILAYCLASGIDTIHTKDAYGVDLSWVSSGFQILYGDRPGNFSLYDPVELAPLRDTGCDVLQVPYSPFNRQWEGYLAEAHSVAGEVHVRSLFVQGKVFTSDEPVFERFRKFVGDLGLPVGTLCILFCLLNPCVDKVIVGVDSCKQLQENLRLFHRLDSFEVHDPLLVDPRTWPTS